MKRVVFLYAVLFAAAYSASAQLQLDKQLQMTGGTEAERRIINVGTPASASDAANAGSVQSGSLVYATASGSGGNYVVALTPPPAAYTIGMIVNFKANHDNTGAATLKVNTLAAIDMKAGVVNDLSAGDIVADKMVSVIFDGTHFQVLGATNAAVTVQPTGPAGGDLSSLYPNPEIAPNAITSAKIADGTITPDDLANTGVSAGTYNTVTVNTKGQATAGTKAPVVYHCTGADQTYTPPAGVTSVTVYMWGAGGGSGNIAGSFNFAFYGGGGGFSTGTIAVTPGTPYTVVVGQGGGSGAMTNTTASYGGGGRSCATNDCRYGGQGGGRSAFRVGGVDLLTAGGGGGGGCANSSINSNRGGAGGGITAQNGECVTNSSAGGGGGGQGPLGGTGGVGNSITGIAGSQYQGGYPGGNNGWGSGAGSGWYGGGGGGHTSGNFIAGGGGGSGYINGSGVSNASTIPGIFQMPAGTNYPYYQHGVGRGGMGNAGGNGLVVIVPN